MILHRLLPAPGDELDVEAPGARDRLLEWYAPRDAEGIRCNLVVTIDGRAAGGDGGSDSLSSRTDRMILGVIRESADAVLVGAGTVRVEGYRLPSRAPLAIVTASGDLAGHRLEPREGAAPVVVLTTLAGAERARASLAALPHRIEIVDETGFSIAQAVGSLRELGFRSLVAEGGPSVIRALLDADLLDELCLTTTPRLGGRALPLLGGGDAPLTPWQRTQLLVDADGLAYARWSRVSASS
ncbi:dihydrofolate reductase family protein [Microcella daejeonensis]|uniref:Dihydrofolate reductase family protein n=1 Tax=Microcella daejeonensis TaxID=2994971 RepID=A0A9E8S8E2_9MICO|nr:dihydrofolate reductase family protein [Microcella daejeonensis]WAB81158.1 dihydrofolate reductase family protein [Microcella daejeonensis]